MSSIERVEKDRLRQDPSWASHLFRYRRAARICAGQTVLDVGHGTGYGAAILKREGGAKHVTAIDMDEVSVQQAQKSWGYPGLDYQVGNAQELGQLKRTFDFVVSFENIEHLPKPEDFLASAEACLNPEGIMLISTPDRANSPPYADNRPVNPYHVQEWYREDFRDLLHKHFRHVIIYAQVLEYAEAGIRNAQQQLSDYLQGVEDMAQQMLRWNRLLKSIPFLKLPREDRLRFQPSAIQFHRPAVSDYSLVVPEIADLVGESICHVAVCSNDPVPEEVLTRLNG